MASDPNTVNLPERSVHFFALSRHRVDFQERRAAQLFDHGALPTPALAGSLNQLSVAGSCCVRADGVRR